MVDQRRCPHICAVPHTYETVRQGHIYLVRRGYSIYAPRAAHVAGDSLSSSVADAVVPARKTEDSSAACSRVPAARQGILTEPDGKRYEVKYAEDCALLQHFPKPLTKSRVAPRSTAETHTGATSGAPDVKPTPDRLGSLNVPCGQTGEEAAAANDCVTGKVVVRCLRADGRITKKSASLARPDSSEAERDHIHAQC